MPAWMKCERDTTSCRYAARGIPTFSFGSVRVRHMHRVLSACFLFFFFFLPARCTSMTHPSFSLIRSFLIFSPDFISNHTHLNSLFFFRKNMFRNDEETKK